MKAEKKYIVNKNRTKLEEVLPLTSHIRCLWMYVMLATLSVNSVRFKPVIVSCILKNR